MKIFTTILASLFLAIAVHAGATQRQTTTQKPQNTGINFQWRQQPGDFPADKPGYLILCTEDALTYSKVLPQFVTQKESMGFYVYVATEKDFILFRSDMNGGKARARRPSQPGTAVVRRKRGKRGAGGQRWTVAPAQGLRVLLSGFRKRDRGSG